MNLDYEFGKQVTAKWRRGWVYGSFVSTITVGRLADGRWFAARHGRGCTWRDTQQGACVYGATGRGRRLAEDTTRRWRRSMGGEWTPVETTTV